MRTSSFKFFQKWPAVPLPSQGRGSLFFCGARSAACAAAARCHQHCFGAERPPGGAHTCPDKCHAFEFTETAQVVALPTVPVTKRADGTGTIETYSVRHDWPVRTGIIVGRLDADGSRFMATSEDPDLVAVLAEADPLGAAVTVTSTENGNRALLR